MRWVWQRPEVRAEQAMERREARAGAAGSLAPFTFPEGGISKALVLSVPTLQRAHDLTVSLVAGLPIVPFVLRWDEATQEQVEEREAPKRWHGRPDPKVSRQAFLGNLASDLWAYGRAYARITSRYVNGNWPASFSYMAFEDVVVNGPANWKPYMGLVPGCRVTFASQEVPFRDVVPFDNPLTGVCGHGWRAIQTAIAMDEASNRFSTVEMPSGWLQQVDGEPLSSEELIEQAAVWAEARATNATGALNQYFAFKESTYDPDRLQLVEGRTYQSLEMARLGNVPPYLVGAPAGTGMTYQNAQQARGDLVDFGASPIIGAIDQGLSSPAISPEGHGVRLNVNAWLINPMTVEKPITSDTVRNPDAPPQGTDPEEKGAQRNGNTPPPR